MGRRQKPIFMEAHRLARHGLRFAPHGKREFVFLLGIVKRILCKSASSPKKEYHQKIKMEFFHIVSIYKKPLKYQRNRK